MAGAANSPVVPEKADLLNSDEQIVPNQKGDDMTTLKAYFAAIKVIITLGASTNAECRKEIRDVVGELADELNRALLLADSYLAGVCYSGSDQELITYLQNAFGKLYTTFSEHHICAGLYSLSDKFKQVFDPTRFSVDIKNYQEIADLLSHLKNGEQAVIDDLMDMIAKLSDYAFALANASVDEKPGIKREIADAVLAYRSEIKAHREEITRLHRKLVDTL